MPKISIIVPVYNAEKYLERCIESLINQTEKDIEIILVDDGSKDTSLEICNRYAKEDKRIKVISQKNAGPSVARNNALKLATGDYIGFVDSDDYVKETTYEEAAKRMSDDVDLVIWGTNVISDDKLGYTDWFQDNYFKLKFRGKIKLTNDAKFKTDVVPWNKLYKASIIKEYNITFPAGRLYEDNAFWWKYNAFCKNAYYINKRLHYYNMRQTSLRGEVIAKKQELEKDRIYMVENVFDFYLENNLLNKQNNDVIDKLFLISYIDAYDETSQKAAITLAGRDLTEKIISCRKGKKSKNFNALSHLNLIENKETKELALNILKKSEFIENSVLEFDKNYTFSYSSDKILTENEKEEIAQNIQEKMAFIQNSDIYEKDVVFANKNIQNIVNNFNLIIENEMKKLGLKSNYDFIKNLMINVPYPTEFEYDGELIANVILPFLSNLLQQNRTKELVKMSYIFSLLYPQCFEFARMLGDAYLFIEKDYDKALYFYLKYTDAIKNNASVYRVLSEICAEKGDIYHQVFFKQKELKAAQNLA